MADIPKEMQELLDRYAIEQVLIKYCNSLTTGDFDGVASCFAKDATFATMVGRDAIRESFAHHYNQPLNTSTMPLDVMTRGTYYISNTQIELKGDTARAFSLGQSRLMGPLGEEMVLLVRGFTYTDDLVREDGVWVIKNRAHATQWMYEATPLQESYERRRVELP